MQIDLSSGFSEPIVINQNNGVSVVAKNVSGTITFELVMPDGTSKTITDDAGADVEYTADFDELIQVRSGDALRVRQTGGTPAATVMTINGNW